MGITRLADLIRLDAPDAVSHKDISDYTGKVIALDTSIVVNQFRAVTPSLSPLTGLFYRTLTLLENDIKPVFVFDGKPPREKKPVLAKRAEAAGLRWPERTGTALSQNNNYLQLLRLLGVPVVQAPGDAEALCAWLVKEGTADAVASEDMDTLPFGGSILIRQLNAKRDSDITEYSLPKLLEKLQISHKEFVDLCILLGCDYCEKIAGLGPKKALKLIQQYRTIEEVVLHVNKKTHPVPHSWNYKDARKIFLNIPQTKPPELAWTEPDEEALVGFLCDTTHVKGDRIRHRMEKFRQIRESKRQEREKKQAMGCGKQTRIDNFFRVTRKRALPVEVQTSPGTNKKRQKTK